MSCPFRTYRPISENRELGGFEEIVCEAGGGFVLGTAQSISVAQEICRACDIPASLSLYHACLNVVPFRVFQDDHVQSYYGCRWHFSRNPQKVPKNIDWCKNCGDWFPRPTKASIPGLIRLSYKIRHIFLNPSEQRKLRSE